MSTKRRTRKNNGQVRRARRRPPARRALQPVPPRPVQLGLRACECPHGGDPCPEPAEFLVRGTCDPADCDCGGASLACPRCMTAWLRDAERTGRPLRVSLL